MYYLYRFLDNENNIIYIGKSKSIKSRIASHSHLPKICYQSCAKVEYARVNNESDLLIYEPYYINLYNPIYNTSLKTGHVPSVRIKDLIFNQYQGNYSKNFTQLAIKNRNTPQKQQKQTIYDYELCNKYMKFDKDSLHIICFLNYGIRKSDGSHIYRLDTAVIRSDCEVNINKLYGLESTITILGNRNSYTSHFQLRDLIKINGIDVSLLSTSQKIKILRTLIIAYKLNFNKNSIAQISTQINSGIEFISA